MNYFLFNANFFILKFKFKKLAGLLTKDQRIKERKKPGKKGARRGYVWHPR